jgi:hypothetical protein
MSKYVLLNVEYKDGECLKGALKEVGYTEIEEHAEAQPLYGYQGDQRAEKANIIIRRKFVGGASNDIGFVKNAKGGYDLVISEFDKHNQKIMNELNQQYAALKTKKQFKHMGFTVMGQKVDPKGRIKIKVVVP